MPGQTQDCGTAFFEPGGIVSSGPAGTGAAPSGEAVAERYEEMTAVFCQTSDGSSLGSRTSPRERRLSEEANKLLARTPKARTRPGYAPANGENRREPGGGGTGRSTLVGRSGGAGSLGDGRGGEETHSHSPGTLLDFPDNADDRRLPRGIALVTVVGGAKDPLATAAAAATAAAGLSGEPAAATVAAGVSGDLGGDERLSMTRPPTTEVRLRTASEISAVSSVGPAPVDFDRSCVMIGFEPLVPIVARRLRCLDSASDTSSSSSSSSCT